MKTIGAITLTFLASALISGCGASRQVMPAPVLNGEIDPDVAIIRLHRESNIIGSGNRWPIFDNENHIGDIANDDFLIWQRDANTIMCISVEKFTFEKALTAVSPTLMASELLKKPDCVRVDGGELNEFEFLFGSIDGRRLIRK